MQSDGSSEELIDFSVSAEKANRGSVMKKQHKPLCKLTTIGLLLFGITNVAAQEDDYLKLLEAEATSTSSSGAPTSASIPIAEPPVPGATTTPTPAPAVTPTPTPAAAPAASNTTAAATTTGAVTSRTDPRARTFEKRFFDGYPGTYALYAQLNNASKLELINLYINSEGEGDVKFQTVIERIVSTLNN